MDEVNNILSRLVNQKRGFCYWQTFLQQCCGDFLRSEGLLNIFENVDEWLLGWFGECVVAQCFFFEHFEELGLVGNGSTDDLHFLMTQKLHQGPLTEIDVRDVVVQDRVAGLNENWFRFEVGVLDVVVSRRTGIVVALRDRVCRTL